MPYRLTCFGVDLANDVSLASVPPAHRIAFYLDNPKFDPSTGRGRLSYRRAAELFEIHTSGFDGGPYTLHQLRPSRLTHAAEEGASTPVLMKLSGHASVRSLTKYARVSDEGLVRYQADSDPAARRRPGR